MSEPGPPPRRVVVFDSIHHVLAAERVFQERSVWCDLIPTPGDLSSDCGMALVYDPADHDKIAGFLDDPRARVRGVYERTGSMLRAVADSEERP